MRDIYTQYHHLILSVFSYKLTFLVTDYESCSTNLSRLNFISEVCAPDMSLEPAACFQKTKRLGVSCLRDNNLTELHSRCFGSHVSIVNILYSVNSVVIYSTTMLDTFETIAELG